MNYPITISREAIDAFEKDTGYKGWGERMVRAGKLKIKEERCKENGVAPLSQTAVKQKENGVPYLTSRA